MNKFKHTSLNWASQNENASINPTTKHSFCSFPSCVERDGIIESRQGVGMFVSPSAAARARAGAAEVVRDSFEQGIRISIAAGLTRAVTESAYARAWQSQRSGAKS